MMHVIFECILRDYGCNGYKNVVDVLETLVILRMLKFRGMPQVPNILFA
jgi:hypothetical protein